MKEIWKGVNVGWLLLVLLIITSCKEEDAIIVKTDFDKFEAIELINGEFISGVHPTSGKVSIQEKSGKFTLLIEDFKTDNGPDLNVYMSSSTGIEDFIDLGDLQGTQGSLSYTLPSGFDETKYNYVLIWCVDFSVLFGHCKL